MLISVIYDGVEFEAVSIKYLDKTMILLHTITSILWRLNLLQKWKSEHERAANPHQFGRTVSVITCDEECTKAGLVLQVKSESRLKMILSPSASK